MTNLELLTARVHELVPSTMELTFGCEVKSGNSHVMRRFITGQNREEGQVFFVDINKIEYNDEYFYSDENLEDIKESRVLGHPIQLADVLRAIGTTKHEVTIDYMGYIYEKGFGFTSQSYVSHWKLNLPLSGQSEETIDFLWEIIK